MKIRQDFVTNRSSSSFIVGFKDKASVKPTLEEEAILGRNFDRVLRDIESHCNSITREEAISLFRDEMEWDVRYEIETGIRDRKDMSYKEWDQWIRDEENMKIVDEMVKEEVDKLNDYYEKNLKLTSAVVHLTLCLQRIKEQSEVYLEMVEDELK